MRGPPRPALLFNRGDPLSEYQSATGSKGFVGQTLLAATLSGRFAGGLLHSRIPSLIGPVFGAIGSPFKPRAGRGYHQSAPRVVGVARMRHQVHGNIIMASPTSNMSFRLSGPSAVIVPRSHAMSSSSAPLRDTGQTTVGGRTRVDYQCRIQMPTMPETPEQLALPSCSVGWAPLLHSAETSTSSELQAAV
jgi:hypothetical protein